MREYLFRGKCGSKWHYGDLYTQSNTPQIIAYNKKYDKMDTAFVDPETVGQYTGMTDISGKKIFEGDIIKTAVTGLTQHTGVVKFSDGAFGLKCTDGGAYFLCFVTGSYAIIGNIHDNKEILKEGGEE